MSQVFTQVIEGRFIMGDMVNAKPKLDKAKNPVLSKKTGEPIMRYFFGVAVPKKAATRDADPTVAPFYNEAVRQFPAGQHAWPSFAFKIEDGDLPNEVGRVYEHAKGCWLFKFDTGIPFKRFAWSGSAWVETDQIRCGDYVQVQCTYENNGQAGTQNTPGMYLSPLQVAFSRRGEEIVNLPEADPNAAGFKPGETLAQQQATGFTPPAQAEPAQQAAPQPAAAAAAPAPNHAFLAPPPAAAPAGPVMTAKAGGATWDQFLQKGWTEETARASGYIV